MERPQSAWVTTWQQTDDDEVLYDTESLEPAAAAMRAEDVARQAMLDVQTAVREEAP